MIEQVFLYLQCNNVRQTAVAGKFRLLRRIRQGYQQIAARSNNLLIKKSIAR